MERSINLSAILL
ncbi:UNVERIFIED_CONTAM: hypothetical protein GTU68_021543 [Idotea baltica]|nr:hypothetical protein [Idotea baltica]